MNYENFRKSLHFQTEILELCEWDEDRQQHILDVLSFSSTKIDLNQEYSPEQKSEMIIALSCSFLSDEEQCILHKPLTNYFRTT